MRCRHCGWLGQHNHFECVAHVAAQIAAEKLLPDGRLPVRQHGLDVRDLRAALAQVRAVSS